MMFFSDISKYFLINIYLIHFLALFSRNDTNLITNPTPEIRRPVLYYSFFSPPLLPFPSAPDTPCPHQSKGNP